MPWSCQIPRLRNCADTREDHSPYSIIHSPSFTFLVGPKHTKLTIQSELARHVSKPLHNLMNNGHTRESKNRIAVLEDEDVETFVAFCEYAYTGDYNVPLSPVMPEGCSSDVVESAANAGHSWREAFLFDSISSAVPRQDQSMPDGDVKAANSAVQAPEATPASVNGEGVSAEVDAEATADAKAEDVPENEPASMEDIDLPATGSAPAVPGEASQQAELELAAEPEKWEDFWTAKPAKAEKAQSDEKKKKQKKKRQEQEWTEPAVVLIPPTIPPPKGPMRAEDVTQDNVLLEPVGDSEAAEPEASEEPPAQSKADTSEWKQSTAFPIEDDTQREEAWAADEAEDLNATDKRSECPVPIIDMSFAKQPDSSPRTPGLCLWDEFTALRYHDDQQMSRSRTNPPTRIDLPYLTFHAKVYVFATRYLIPALAQLCLRKLHRELLHLSFADADPMDTCSNIRDPGELAARQVPIVLDLLRYSYTKTTRLEPISPTSATQLRENELRRLVVHYAACKVKELARYHSPGDSETATPTIRPVDVRVERADDAAPRNLRALLDGTPELASDLVYRMM